MNMKTVKNITIPEGNVKKIVDSNGDIIWASYDEFPYRRLEYVTTNKDAAIDTGITAGTYSVFYLKIMPTNIGTQQRVLCNYNSSATQTRKYPLIINAGGSIQNTIGNN